MTTIDRRELTPSFELLGRYLAPILDLRFFLPLKRFLFVGYPIAFLALLHCLIFFFRCRHDTFPLAFLTLWHYEVCKSARSAWW